MTTATTTTTTMMKAIRLHAFGGPEVLRYEDAPVPPLKPGEVLVRVHAVGINPPDWYLREGYRMLPPEWQPPIAMPAIPGTDVSGVVDAVAPGVQGLAVGDEVFGMVRFPSYGDSAAYAEYVAAPASDLARKPAGISHVQAAAVPMALLTAWQFLIELGHDHPNPLQPQMHRPVPIAGKTVLVNGAAGGVGHFAVQLAKVKGAHVITVASGAHEAFLRGLGADEAAQRGFTVSATQVRSSGAQLAQLAGLLGAGTVRVAIDSTFALADARSAHERAARGHIRGKIVLTVR
jgi:NADPH:quinone reductase-like Zn-dependent oxidoreductase